MHDGAQQLPHWSANVRSVEAVEIVREGGGGLVSILGRRGSGRTTILHALQQRFGDEARLIAVEQWLVDQPLSLFDRLVEVVAPALHSRLMPWLIETFHNADNQLGPEFAEASRKILHELTESGPIVVLIDDIHLADAPSQQLLSYIGRRLAHTGVVMVFTATTHTKQLIPDMLGLLNTPGASRVEVTPLESYSMPLWLSRWVFLGCSLQA